METLGSRRSVAASTRGGASQRGARVGPRAAAGLLPMALLGLLLSACSPQLDIAEIELRTAPRKLSEYDLFVDGNGQSPEPGVVPYTVRSALFSDYAIKDRFVRLPEGGRAVYDAEEAFELPVGSVLVKSFSYPIDARRPELGKRVLETRLLLHTGEGWLGLPYIWDEDGEDATLRITGGVMPVSWTDATGASRQLSYLVPNANQCKGCHRAVAERTVPIGVKARYLNHPFDYPEGTENQLAHWRRHGLLDAAPDPESAPQVAVWDDPATGSVEERARTYLEINCAHCHNPQGPARTSGLDLTYAQRDPVKWGVFKSPVAAGRGSGDRRYSILPGSAEDSILYYRMESLDPGVMMPELGRRSVHTEGLELIREWIEELDAETLEASPDKGSDRANLSRFGG